MILPESFYNPGSYNNWIRVGWALKNTNEKLILTWIKFSLQSTNCDFTDLYYLIDKYKQKKDPLLLIFISSLIELYYNELSLKNHHHLLFFL